MFLGETLGVGSHAKKKCSQSLLTSRAKAKEQLALASPAVLVQCRRIRKEPPNWKRRRKPRPDLVPALSWAVLVQYTQRRRELNEEEEDAKAESSATFCALQTALQTAQNLLRRESAPPDSPPGKRLELRDEPFQQLAPVAALVGPYAPQEAKAPRQRMLHRTGGWCSL